MTSTNNDSTIAFVPEIDSVLVLQKDWECHIFDEYRNDAIIKADGYPLDIYRGGDETYSPTGIWNEVNDDVRFYKRTFPAGSEFIIRRIYVRNGSTEYSSVTMSVANTTDPNLLKIRKGKKPFCRFWVKLADFNNAKFTMKVDKAISAIPTEHRGKPLTLKKLINRQYPRYFVKFEHADPELSFDGILETHRTCPRPCTTRQNHLLSKGWTENVRTISGVEWMLGFPLRPGSTVYMYTAPSYVGTFVPQAWRDAHNDPKYLVEETQQLSPHYPLEKIVISKHPLEDQIFIPIDKKAQKAIGLAKQASEIVDVPVAGGKLSLYEIEMK